MNQIAQLNGFAVDLGGTKTAVASIDSGQINERRTIQTEGNSAPNEHIEKLTVMLRDVGYRPDDRLGVAVTGRVDARGDWHAVNRATLQGIEAIPLGKIIADKIGPASLVNDAAAATLAEAQFGSGVGLQNFGYITVSTGVGGGLFLGGRLHQSANGLAGHIGFSSSSLSLEMCGSGRFGTVESIASGNAIARAAQCAGYHDLDARDVFERAVQGEHWADGLIDKSAQAIANLCADLTVTLGLEAIALGGSIGLAKGYLGRVQSHIETIPEIFRPKLVPASLAHDGPLLGALIMATHDD